MTVPYFDMPTMYSGHVSVGGRTDAFKKHVPAGDYAPTEYPEV